MHTNGRVAGFSYPFSDSSVLRPCSVNGDMDRKAATLHPMGQRPSLLVWGKGENELMGITRMGRLKIYTTDVA